MATGIVSTSAFLLGFEAIARVLLVANGLFFVALVGLTVLRVVRFVDRVRADFLSHERGAGFFTTVAGSCVLGTQLALIQGSYGIAIALWWLGLALWLFLIYGFLAAVMAAKSKPSLEKGINGGWLVGVVATQSVSVLATVLWTSYASGSTGLLFLSLCFSLAGGVLYLILITILFYRLAFFSLPPESLSPLSWIAMGAAAISTLSGARLDAASSQSPLLGELLPFLQGMTLLFWATATWWIPLLLALGVWRHGVRRHPVRYEPQYWGMVFPLGMYTAATVMVSQATGLDFLLWIHRVSFWIALAAWVIVFVGMLMSIVNAARRSR